MVRLGAHESVAGGLAEALRRAGEDGCESVQLWARPKVRWEATPLLTGEAEDFRRRLRELRVPSMTHASYLINLCAPDRTVLERSVAALEEELVRAEELGLDFVVLHPGAHGLLGLDEGLTLAAGSMDRVLARTRGFRVQLLLEHTAGQGTSIGCSFEQLARLLDRCRAGDRVGICLDTCHAHASGQDLSTVDGYQAMVADFQRVLGLERLRAFHLNDSRTPAGSRVDRHADPGDGFLGILPFWCLLNDTRFTDHPGVLEIPPGPDGARTLPAKLARLRRLRGAPRPRRKPPAQKVASRSRQ